ncbi:MAG: peptidoglycan DD-metalloendopeptidase family protein [bacterium]|nr:peptidoglycan DD-metalloendopeptidase family protein [bacterium]
MWQSDVILNNKFRYRRRWLVLGWSLALLATLNLALVTVVTAASLDSKSISELRAAKEQLEKVAQQKREAAKEKAADAQAAKEEIAKLDKSINATQGRIVKTSTDITNTEGQIGSLSEQITQKESDIEQKKGNIQTTLRKFFKMQLVNQEVGYVGIIFGQEGISKKIRDDKNYASVKRELDRQKADLMVVKADLEHEKQDQETKKVALQNYRQQQEIQKRDLSEQEQRQAALKQDAEVAYASLKQEEKDAVNKEAEVEAIITRKIQESLRLGSGIRASGQGTPVSQGNIIGHLGSTGFSTGPHIHFSVFTPQGATVNPRTRLGSNYIWPVVDYRITQEYGAANWRNPVYSFHNGIDLAGPAGQPVYAAADGKIILDEYYGGYGNAVVIEHSDGWLTLYGHMTGR